MDKPKKPCGTRLIIKGKRILTKLKVDGKKVWMTDVTVELYYLTKMTYAL